MIEYDYNEVDFEFNEALHSEWLSKVIVSEQKEEGIFSYLFCTDDYLLEINKKYLQHDYYTDIITFDNTEGNILGADVCISIDRVRANALDYEVSFEEELRRVLVHGVLHTCGYKDKTEEEATKMRKLEDEKMALFHVEQNKKS